MDSPDISKIVDISQLSGGSDQSQLFGLSKMDISTIKIYQKHIEFKEFRIDIFDPEENMYSKMIDQKDLESFKNFKNCILEPIKF